MISNFPSWADYGTHDESRFPELWEGCIYASAFCLGQSGNALFDHSRFRNHGTATSMTLNDRLFLSDGQYCFEPMTSMAFTHGLIPQITGDCTFSCWFRHTATGADQCAITTRNILTGAGRNGIAIYLMNGGAAGASAEFAIGGTRYTATISATYSDGIWRCATAQRINGTTRLTIGTTTATSAGSSTGTISHEVGLRIGSWADYSTGAFILQLDDVRIYDRSLSIGEVNLLQTGRGVSYQRKRRKSYFSEQVAVGFSVARSKRSSQLIGGGTY